MGGRFNFFDAPAYVYAGWDAAWTKSAQEERFRVLNRYVRMTHGGTGPYADSIDSLYPGGVDTPGSVSASPPPLPGWVTNPAAYAQVLRPNCRTCHIWQPPPYDLAAPDPGLGEWLRDYLCSGIMPNAMQPTLNVWRRLDPFAGDALTTAFDVPACFSSDASPTVQILEPASGSSFDVGGFFALHLRAETDDAEEGPGCCTVTWSSDRDGLLGAGHDVYAALSTGGPHVITATARDGRWRIGTASVTVTATNSAPSPEILFPVADGDDLYRGIPYLVLGRATDDNQPLGLPCSSLSWTSSIAGDAPFPTTGCHPEVTFTTNGSRTLRLTATDAAAEAVTVMRVVDVIDPPLDRAPIPTISSPAPGSGHDGRFPFLVRGSAVDPDGTDTVTWELRARRLIPAVDVVIGSGSCAPGAACNPTLNWRPQDSLGMACGSYDAEIELRATDIDGTDSATVAFVVTHPPC
jgi:hypothetical protein